MLKMCKIMLEISRCKDAVTRKESSLVRGEKTFGQANGRCCMPNSPLSTLVYQLHLPEYFLCPVTLVHVLNLTRRILCASLELCFIRLISSLLPPDLMSSLCCKLDSLANI